MLEELFLKTGMSFREIKIYERLLNSGQGMASELAKATGIIRTNTYDILNSLIKKGLVAYVVKNGRKYFNAAPPERVIDFINSQKDELEETKQSIIATLPKIVPKATEGKKTLLEIYEGKEGMKTILSMSIRESVRTKKEILGISVQQQRCRDLAGPYHVRWYKEREKLKIKSRYLMSAEEPIIPVKHTSFKVLPKEAKNPNELFIFGDITAEFFFVEDIFTAAVINSKEITDKYRNYFGFLWNIIK